MTDDNLSKRAGLNIGIEPSLLPYIRAAKGSPIQIVNEQGDTLIAEPTDKAARVIMLESSNGLGGGYVLSTDPAGADANKILHLWFIDELGNEVEVETSSLVGSEATGFHVAANMSPIDFFCLAPGEKIIARVTTGGGQ